MKKVTLISNIPAPYRERVYEILSEITNEDFRVIYCSKIEDNRKWKLDNPSYNVHFLNTRTIKLFWFFYTL